MDGAVEVRKALVTGASRGIGRGIALALAREGYDLAITYSTNEEEAQEVARTIRDTCARECHVIQASMEKEDVPSRTVDEAVRRMGRLDLLVNNAGLTIFEPITELKLDNLNLLINLDFKGYILAMQAAAKHMIGEGIKGNIINITSSRGRRAYPYDSVYGGMKAALARATESIAIELAPHGIRVNCIAPGATRVRKSDRHELFYSSLAGRIPLCRVGEPDDIGNAVAWLASEKASYITGVTLRIDGGLILPGMPEGPGYKEGWGINK
jgi:NAD(P)-dependent dehydrogenase (short-subunit alcohol dehydrogenase family)